MTTGLDDITIVFLTVNKVPEKWVAFHKKCLFEAIGDTPIITVSTKPMPDMPGINLIQTEEICSSNIYRQILRAAKITTTPYLAIVEDDSLYHRDHFTWFRPQSDEFAYNLCRWAVFTWGIPTYFWRERISNLTMIAPTEFTVKRLEERFEKYPNGTPENCTGELGKERIEKKLGLTVNKHVYFYTNIPVVNLNHVYSIDPREVNKKKAMSAVRAFDIPYWGRAEDLVKNFV